MDLAILNAEGMLFLLRWIHFLAGVVWIGLLYYFNFVQATWFKTADAGTKSAAIRGLVPEALWWFRWGAMVTFLTGWLIIGARGHESSMIFLSSWGIFILTGALFGTTMFLNVWLVIWPNQRIVIGSAETVAKGGSADPRAADAAAKALLASRTNVMFSFPMLFCMGAAGHLPILIFPDSSVLPLAAALATVVGVLELNALKGKLGPMTTVRGVIHCGVALTVVVYGLVEVLL